MRLLSLKSLGFSLLFMSTLQVTTIHSQRAIETFVWRYGNLNFGTLEVPRGYLAETQNYTEGVVTRLCYPDQSCFVLQRGFMYRIPMFQDLDDIMDFSKKSKEKTIRRGHYKGKS